MSRKRKAVDVATLDMFALDVNEGAVLPEASGEALTAAQVLQGLRLWADAGWLRRLDVALAAFVHEQDPEAAACVLVAAAMLTQMEGRGHSCIDLTELVRDPQAILVWTAEQQPLLQHLWQRLPSHVNDWLQALQASPLVRVVERAVDAGQPLVLAGMRQGQPQLYLRRYWNHERLVAGHILQRSQAASEAPAVDAAHARDWLERLFPRSVQLVPRSSPALACDWQKMACAVALRGRFTGITGGPGTGKTYTAARLLALLFATAPQAEQLRVALAAPTGKAAARLKQSIDGALRGLQGVVNNAFPLQQLVERVGAARTLHALLGARPDTRHFKHHAGNPLDVDVLIVDEASMVHLEMMYALLDALPPQARLILLGDKDQLASVEAGAVLGDLCRDAELGQYSPSTAAYLQQVSGEVLPPVFVAAQQSHAVLPQHTVMLRQSRRFEGDIGALAQAVNGGQLLADGGKAPDETPAQQALQVLQESMRKHGLHAPIYSVEGGAVQQVHALALHGRGNAPGYGAYAQALQQGAQVLQSADADQHTQWVTAVLKAFDRFRLLCAVREGEWGVQGLNAAVEKALEAQGWLRKTGEWYVGRPVMVTRNDAALNVFNGDIGIALPSMGSVAGQHPLRVYFLDGDALRSVGVARLAHVETAFAMTVHKSQGSEFEHTVLVLSAQAGGVLGRELVYTGITRARSYFTLMAERPGLLAAAIASPTRRASGLLRFLEGSLHA